jgi:hypothetical protein
MQVLTGGRTLSAVSMRVVRHSGGVDDEMFAS